MASARPQVGRASVAENVIKQGYLKKSVRSSDPVPSATKQIATNIKQKFEPSRWYVFGVRFGTPYLEYFESEEKVFTNRPLEIHDLSTYRNLTYTLGRTNTNFTFCIFLEHSTIELTAQNRAQMLDWCRSLERHLRNLGIGNKKAKEDHTYAPFPVAYKPTRTSSLEDLVGLEGATGLDIEADTSQENIYFEADDVKQFRKDENGNDRSSPPLPPRPRKSDEDESVFASISSIQKLPDNEYNNCGSATAGILDEEELYDDCTEGGLANEVAERSQNQSALNDNEWERFNKTVDNNKDDDDDDIGDEEDDRCASMPIIPSKEVPESDTSEDSDFIPASFWLRNRKQEDLISFDDSDLETVQLRHTPGYNGTNAPLLPTRAQSVRVDSRRCVSLYSSAPDIDVENRNSSLLTSDMNPKPVPKPRKSPVPNHENKQKSDSSNQNQSGDTFEKGVCANNHSKPCDELVGRLTTDADDNGDDGSYEALFEATQGHKTAPKPVADTVYETTWGSASHGDKSCASGITRSSASTASSATTTTTNQGTASGTVSDTNRGSADLNDRALGEGQCNPEYEPVEVVEGKTEIKDQPKEDDGYIVPPKRKGITKLFSRLSSSKDDKDKSLPDALFVSLPPRNRKTGSSACAKGGCDSAEEEEVTPPEGNLYTDFPEDQMSKCTTSSAESGGAKSKVVDYYSRPKKASSVDDTNPKSMGCKETSPVLPKRNLAASVGGASRQVPAEYTMVNRNLSKSCSETRSFNNDKPHVEEVYEDVCNGDISGSAHSPLSDKSQALLYDSPYDSGPVAPPRRNKPTASIAPVTYSFANGQHKTVISNNKPTSYELAATLPVGEKPAFNFTDPPLPPRIDSLPPKSGTSSAAKLGSLDRAPAPPAISSLPDRSSQTKNSVPERPPPPRPSRHSPTERPPLPSPSERPAMPLPRDDGPPTSQAPPPPVLRRGMTRSQSNEVQEPRPPAARPKTSYMLNRTPSQSGMNLKQNQVDVLRAERDSIGGMVRQIPKAHFQNGLALVQCFDRIWIAGWDVKKYPRLYDKFHIGDELISVNDVQLVDLPFAYKLVKNIKADHIEVTVRRLPMARIFAIQRSAEGESLGIKREGGTAEIVYVDPHGLAARFGLSAKASTMSGGGLCNWCLTEINMRHLNLFFKDSEIEHRLLAVGRDISIIVQPSDFIKELKKQLKKIRGYKDYLIQ